MTRALITLPILLALYAIGHVADAAIERQDTINQEAFSAVRSAHLEQAR
ncbi:hypothetical protein SAMN06297251_10293 [Fulvimarina manganoxydans]|uniref:Uncharacterized protein n=1 Tax=Fulvimarina manganoxydans TaxID=937218 RepID=A0A1W1YYF6_9HYPH|nr:hypothetical protein [Fulvimarina manganoxydans]SMC41245.1 hypothetical protein SAMN06297251_10293 [Fulvimarina manganoxydans]